MEDRNFEILFQALKDAELRDKARYDLLLGEVEFLQGEMSAARVVIPKFLEMLDAGTRATALATMQVGAENLPPGTSQRYELGFRTFLDVLIQSLPRAAR